ncbi:MAG: DUF4179 domain-containing protein [Anaerolineae bacterium]|nr:DUF4179 domain-containing protein [Anaerolineae bacterium]
MNHEPWSDLRDRLIQSAPQPTPEFKHRLLNELKQELDATPTRSRLRLPYRWILAAVLLMIISASGYAVHTFLQLQPDPALQSVYFTGKGIPLDAQQTLNGYTIALQWVYADSGQVVIAWTLQGDQDTIYTNLDSHAKLFDASGIEYPLAVGMGTYAASNLPADLSQLTFIPESITGAVYQFQIPEALLGSDTIEATLQINASYVTAARRTEVPFTPPEGVYDTPDWWVAIPGLFEFTLTIPVEGESAIRSWDGVQIAQDQGLEVRLQQVIVTTAQTRFTLCFSVPDAAYRWTLAPRLSIQGLEVKDAMISVANDDQPDCETLIYQVNLFDQRDPWQFEITEWIGFGTSGADQRRIAGQWRFLIEIP